MYVWVCVCVCVWVWVCMGGWVGGWVWVGGCVCVVVVDSFVRWCGACPLRNTSSNLSHNAYERPRTQHTNAHARTGIHIHARAHTHIRTYTHLGMFSANNWDETSENEDPNGDHTRWAALGRTGVLRGE